MNLSQIKRQLFNLLQSLGTWLVSFANRRPQTMVEVFGEKGIFAQSPTYEFRQPQLEIAEEIFSALTDKQHLLAEAGTGTGKTLAYLVPAIIHAQNINSPVVIATGTKQLQDQIGDKDIPFLHKMLPFKFTSVVLKGASNYACLAKIREKKNNQNTETLTALEAALKLAKNGGEWNELDYAGDDSNNLSVTRSKCDKCSLQAVCPFTKLIAQSKTADIIITNHHNWLSNVKANKHQNIPAHKNVIFDEAHLLEKVATNIFTSELQTRDFSFLFRVLTNDKFAYLRKLIFSIEENTRQIAKLSTAEDNVNAEIHIELEMIFNLLKTAIRDVEKQQIRWQQGFLNQLYFLFEKINIIIEHKSDDDFILSAKALENGFALQSIPIETHIHLRKIFARKDSAVFVSATLSANGDFEFSHYFLGLDKDKTRETQTGSPFDYAAQGLLYMPDLCEPRSKEFIPQSVAEIIKLTEISEGRAFVLCTSKTNAEKLCAEVRTRTDFPCFLQGEDNLSTNELVNKFKETPNAILFGTSTFWQGVDVQGSQLSCVIIDRLPFAVPTDAAFIAKAAKLEAKGKNPFFNYSLPQAVIQLNQGVGRLVRSMNDTGIVCILDRRANQSKYAEYILNNLPNFTRTNDLKDADAFIKDKTLLTQTFEPSKTVAQKCAELVEDSDGNLRF